MIKDMRPIGNHVLVKIDVTKETLDSGIFIPLESQEEPRTATIVRSGIGKYYSGKLVSPELKEGMRVYLPKHGGRIMQEDLILFNEDEILGFWE